jgi:hypothetical protein
MVVAWDGEMLGVDTAVGELGGLAPTLAVVLVVGGIMLCEGEEVKLIDGVGVVEGEAGGTRPVVRPCT